MFITAIKFYKLFQLVLELSKITISEVMNTWPAPDCQDFVDVLKMFLFIPTMISYPDLTIVISLVTKHSSPVVT